MLSDSSGARSEGGRLFQVAGPNTAKLRWPVEVRTLGKRSVPVVAERIIVLCLFAGFPKFVQLKELFDGRFISDDAIYFKVHVDISRLMQLQQ